MKIVDLKDMQGFNDEVLNGKDSVSTGRVFLSEYAAKLYPTCIKHGAINKVTKYGIWRCLTCHEGCYQVD
jgi:hypothetical protein